MDSRRPKPCRVSAMSRMTRSKHTHTHTHTHTYLQVAPMSMSARTSSLSLLMAMLKMTEAHAHWISITGEDLSTSAISLITLFFFARRLLPGWFATRLHRAHAANLYACVCLYIYTHIHAYTHIRQIVVLTRRWLPEEPGMREAVQEGGNQGMCKCVQTFASDVEQIRCRSGPSPLQLALTSSIHIA
jgi:hypothetical protein